MGEALGDITKAHSRRRRSALGLKARVTLAFTAGALVLSGALATITYLTTSRSILSEETSSIQDLAYSNAFTAQRVLEHPSDLTNLNMYPHAAFSSHLAVAIPSLLGEINGGTIAQTQSLIYVSSVWYHYPTTFTSHDLPPGIVALTKDGTAAEQYFSYHNAPRLAIGIPIPAAGAIYIGVFDLASTANTLRVLLATLLIAAAAMTIAGAIVGRWAASRALRPLKDVSRAALAIASGKLDTRLDPADASDLAVLMSSFNTMVDRLQQRIERDARFTSDVSHELRSPLTTLATSLSVLEARRDELPERSGRALDLLGAEVRRFQRMVKDLLEISLLDAGASDLACDHVGIGELIRRASASYGTTPVPVYVAPEAEHRIVNAEKRRIERVMVNLLENADRYAGGATRITVNAHKNRAIIAVEDNGPGIPAAERANIFDRFRRGSSDAGKRGLGSGTGLGLALVMEHVKLHGGTVMVEDSPTGGARFVFELPIADDDIFDGVQNMGHDNDKSLGPGQTSIEERS